MFLVEKGDVVAATPNKLFVVVLFESTIPALRRSLMSMSIEVSIAVGAGAEAPAASASLTFATSLKHAQGAGLAIEDAAHVADVVQHALDTDAPWNMQSIIDSYWQKRITQVRKLHHVSNLAQMIEHVESSAIVSCRDFLMSVVPSSAKSYIFDLFLRYATR